MFNGAPVRVRETGPAQWHTSIDSFALQGLSYRIDDRVFYYLFPKTL